MKKIFDLKISTALLVCLMCVFSSFSAFAWPGPGRGPGRPVHPPKYYYRGAHWSRPAWFGFNFYVSSPPRGAFVEVLPLGYRTIVVGPRRYYYYEKVYYEPYETGYVVVEPPVEKPTVVETAPTVIVSQPQTNVETMTVNIPNSKGGYTPVKLVKKDGGYVGPQGEFYPTNPTVEQLKVLYGK